jgi:hypothetical protein
MTQKEFKEANRLHWIVKGHLIPDEYSDEDVSAILDSYFRRCWGNHENVVHEVGFDQAWELKYGK